MLVKIHGHGNHYTNQPALHRHTVKISDKFEEFTFRTPEQISVRILIVTIFLLYEKLINQSLNWCEESKEFYRFSYRCPARGNTTTTAQVSLAKLRSIQNIGKGCFYDHKMGK